MARLQAQIEADDLHAGKELNALLAENGRA